MIPDSVLILELIQDFTKIPLVLYHPRDTTALEVVDLLFRLDIDREFLLGFDLDTAPGQYLKDTVLDQYQMDTDLDQMDTTDLLIDHFPFHPQILVPDHNTTKDKEILDLLLDLNKKSYGLMYPSYHIYAFTSTVYLMMS